jgi:pimeloyl-ACP methyl ester carboxylesterase
VSCPILAIFGASDLLLPVQTSVHIFQRDLAKAGNNDVTIQVFGNAGHLITNPSTGELAPGFLELLTVWAKQRVQVLPPASTP